jgi:hypothetical protein
VAKRAINAAGSTPTGYTTGHTTPAAAWAAAANDDQISYTEAFEVLSTVNSSLTGIQYGVDTESGTGVADIAHTGSGIYSGSRAGQYYYNATPTFQCTGSCDITWLQFRHYNTVGGNSSAIYANGGGAITCKNVLASVDGSQDFSCFQVRTQTGASGPSSLTLDYCMGTVDISMAGLGECVRVWNHSTAYAANLTTRNCTFIVFTDAAGGGQSFHVLDASTPTTVDILSTACQWYGKSAGAVAGPGATFTAGASGVGHNASANSEHGGAIDLGSTRWEADDGTLWYANLGSGRDLTPLFPSTRAGPDNSANAAKNDAAASVDFAGVVIGTFDVGCFDQGGGGGGGGETLNDLEAGTLEVWALISSMNAGDA